MTASHDKVVTLYTLRAGEDGTGGGGVGGTGYEQVEREGGRTDSLSLEGGEVLLMSDVRS